MRIEPNEIIAWRTTPGSSVAGTGVIRFEAPDDKTTRIDIQMSYNPPGGMLGHALALISGTDPKSAMDDDLARVKSLLETGKTRAHRHRVTADAGSRAEAAKPG